MNAYEHRLNPDNPAQVQVRRYNPKRTHGIRGNGWREYMSCTSEADARRILSMLQRHEPQRMVYE